MTTERSLLLFSLLFGVLVSAIACCSPGAQGWLQPVQLLFYKPAAMLQVLFAAQEIRCRCRSN